MPGDYVLQLTQVTTMQKPLLASLLFAPLLGVSFSSFASYTVTDFEVRLIHGSVTRPWLPAPGAITSRSPDQTFIFQNHRHEICPIVAPSLIPYIETFSMFSDVTYSHTGTTGGNQCSIWFYSDGALTSRAFAIRFSVYDFGDEPPEPSCLEGLTESCCEQLAEYECRERGGCESWQYFGADAIGGERCEFTCYDDIDPPDNGDPGTNPDPNPGDDDPDPDPDPSPDPGDDPNPNPGDDDPDPNPGDGGDGDDWDYTPPAPGQGAIINVGGGAGSGGVTVDVSVDTSAIEGWLQILADKPGFNDFGILTAIDLLRQGNQQDANTLVAAINALRDGNEELASALIWELKTANTALTKIEGDTARTADGVDSISGQMGSVTDLLSRIADSLASGDGDGTAPGDGSGSGLGDGDWSIPIPGVDPDNPGEISDYGHFGTRYGGFADRVELPEDFTTDAFELDRFDISSGMADYQPFLPSSECIGVRTYSINGLTVSLDWNPLCDIFRWIGYLVMVSAWFSVPFIVFGTSKK